MDCWPTAWRPIQLARYVTFSINPAARFSDGRPVTAEDVIFSWQLLRDHGRPNFGIYYSKVVKAESDGRRVRFDFGGGKDRELPLILGLMPIVAKHATDPETFEKTSFTPPLGTGPYTVSKVKPGASVTFARDPDYWGRELPINRGLWNFDTIRFDYYRDGNTHFEAFKTGLYDARVETDPGRWQTGYNFPAFRTGKVVKDEFPYGLPKGMQGLVFNTRRPDVCRRPRARSDPAVVRLRVAQPYLFFRSLPSHRQLFRRLPAVRARPAGQCARTRAPETVSRRGAS